MDGVERIDQHTDTMTRWVAKELEAKFAEQFPDERVA